MDVFKSDIHQKQPTVDTDFKNLLQRENILVSFPEQLPTLKQTEHLLISEAMRRANNNQAIAAQLLGITRQALNKRLKTTSQ
jgi:transcriptional regulator with PAS, ATPase and Fis domain